ncbi:SHOCT domain-containing protein [Arthrobacter sp. CAN_C5]|uniref:SHOCT domain-containing protein n=2 Tax=unclassified Arthrobacter TaxID=235627 RepID=UPI001FD9E46B|nr:SHOCT domain-containing protein [Arthrobacter sp. CAN_C5]MBP2216870.1 putative membrane protein [Arthrobacter sp. CAN_C5]
MTARRKASGVMWDYGQGSAWMWLWSVLLLGGIVLLVLLAVKVVGNGSRFGYASRDASGLGGPPRGRSSAHQILDERFAKGELTADEYREHLKVLGEGL